MPWELHSWFLAFDVDRFQYDPRRVRRGRVGRELGLDVGALGDRAGCRIVEVLAKMLRRARRSPVGSGGRSRARVGLTG